MKVRELIEELQKLDPELTVIKQKDDEGNGFHQVYGVDTDAYSPNPDDYEVEIYAEEDVNEQVDVDGANRDDYIQVAVLY